MTHHLRVFALGTGGAVTSPARDNTSLLVELDGAVVLIDCSGSPCRKIVAAGIDSLHVATVILTHQHIDHVYGLPSFIQHHYLRLRYAEELPPGSDRTGYALRLVCPEETAPTVSGLLELHGFAGKELGFPITIDALPGRSGQTHLPGSWRLHHVAGRHGQVTSLGLIIEDPAGSTRLACSGDTEPTDAFLERAAGADLLVHECQTASDAPEGHTDAHTLAAMLQRYPLPRAVLPVHLATGDDDQGQAVHRALSERLSTEVLVPRDGMLALDSAGPV
jgi:ribonuclease Z